MRNTFVNTLIEACTTRDDIIFLSGDSGLGVFDQFRSDYPDRFRNTGAAEQNATSYAAGLALSGLKVVVYNLIPFLLYRCYEQVRNDICYQELPVILVGIGSGITYAPQGMSHYAVEDIGIARTLPNLVTISPMDPLEARAAALYALTCDRPVYVRLAKCGEAVYHVNTLSDITLPQVVREGQGTAIVFHGSVSREVMTAYDTLRAKGRAPLLVSVPTVQPLAVPALLAVLAGVTAVICVEEHYSSCGLGSALAALKAEQSLPWSLTLMGIPPHFIHEIGTTAFLRATFGISADDIVLRAEASYP